MDARTTAAVTRVTIRRGVDKRSVRAEFADAFLDEALFEAVWARDSGVRASSSKPGSTPVPS
jgi:hypothetical protein